MRNPRSGWLAPLAALLLSCSSQPAAPPPPPPEDPRIGEARAFLDRMKALEDKFDPAVGDLYADEARMKRGFKFGDGELRFIEMTGAEFKKEVPRAMEEAAKQGDVDSYEDVRIFVEGPHTRVVVLRYCPALDYRTELALLVGKDATGALKVLESVSKPIRRETPGESPTGLVPKVIEVKPDVAGSEASSTAAPAAPAAPAPAAPAPAPAAPSTAAPSTGSAR